MGSSTGIVLVLVCTQKRPRTGTRGTDSQWKFWVGPRTGVRVGKTTDQSRGASAEHWTSMAKRKGKDYGLGLRCISRAVRGKGSKICMQHTWSNPLFALHFPKH